VTPPQPASNPASITFTGKTHIFLREAPASPIQYKEVAPPPSPDSVSSSILRSTSNNVNPSGKTAAKPQNTIESAPPSQMGLGYGASWKAEYSRLADEIHLRHYSSKTLQTYQGWDNISLTHKYVLLILPPSNSNILSKKTNIKKKRQ